MQLLDFLFPRRCVVCKAFGFYLCTACFTRLSFDVETICTVCNTHAIDGITHPGCMGRYTLQGTFSSVSYDGAMKKILFAYKYEPYIRGLEPFLTQLFYEGLIQKEHLVPLISKNPILIPIPLHISKFRERGYNQAEILARGVSKKLQIPWRDSLVRKRRTISQVSLTKAERKKNIANVFMLKEKDKSLIKDKIILLVDDVMTTGSTLTEAGRILKKAGAKEVWGITLAHGN